MVGTLQAELQQTKPFRSVAEEAYLALSRTAAVLDHAVAQALRAHDLTPTQYNVLRILRGAGTDGLCRNELGARLLRAVPDVTRLLDRMEELGLIARERLADDRRMVRTRLTARGLTTVNDMDRPIRALHERLLGGLGEGRQKQLIRLLDEVRSGVGREEG
ncbi:MAG: MarR family winged helix-turn-helix transcriptional regulator [Vicinamibacterales bacterium]